MCPHYCRVVVRHVHIELMRWPWVTRETLGGTKTNKSTIYVDAMLWPEILKTWYIHNERRPWKGERQRERESADSRLPTVGNRKERSASNLDRPQSHEISRAFQSTQCGLPSTILSIYTHRIGQQESINSTFTATQPSVFLATGVCSRRVWGPELIKWDRIRGGIRWQ